MICEKNLTLQVLNMNLLERVKQFKKQTGISYKKIYTDCEIGESVFYNFTSGIRQLTAQKQIILDEYLKKLGY